MGHKIFVSYKYADDQVANLAGQSNSTVRDYVDKLEEYLDSSSHIYKGESSGEDLSKLEEETIWSKLRDRIFDSTMTIVFISPGMQVSWMKEKDQWIPWEVSFSLRTSKRKTQNGGTYTSNPNAMLAVVLPDTNSSYDYFHINQSCCTDGCTSIRKDDTFTIIGQNMFNLKLAKKNICKSGLINWHGEASYIGCVRWDDFIKNTESHIDAAYKRQKDIENYDIRINLN